MTIVFAEKAHKSWPYTSVTNVSDELGNTGWLNEFPSLWKFRTQIIFSELLHTATMPIKDAALGILNCTKNQ